MLKLKKSKFALLLSVLLCCCMVFGSVAMAEEPEIEPVNPDQVLRETGMPQSEIDAMDPQFKIFIVQSLRPDSEYVGNLLIPTPYAGTLTQVKLTCTSFKNSDNTYDIYPTYEFTAPLEPKGNDTFAFSLGDGLSVVPDSFNGQLWYKDSDLGVDDWTTDWAADALYASEESIQGYSVAGSQLGTPGFPTYFKGACHFSADIDRPTATKKVGLRYVNDTSGNATYSIFLQLGIVGFDVSSGSGSINTKSQVFYLAS